MNQSKMIEQAYSIAKERYESYGIDTNEVLKTMQELPISINSWQADDVVGFDNESARHSGGNVVTGNYPGRARNIDEVQQDMAKVCSLVPGTQRINVQASYGHFEGKIADRNELEPKHFQKWMEWAKETGVKLDFNTTFFSHPKSGNLSLANPDSDIRDFWIEHTKRVRKIADEMGRYQDSPCWVNVWVHDGSKDTTVNALLYRTLLKEALDEVYKTKYDNIVDCLEAKLFSIGAESYTVGSYDFYLGYCAKNNVAITLDTGHFHATESVADKISATSLFVPAFMLHISRPVRWDSDHVVTMNDDTLSLAQEIIRCGVLDRTNVGLDFFDASINRVGGYIVGTRSTQKCFMQALLEPISKLREFESNNQLFERLALLEEAKGLPWNAVWDYFCLTNNVPIGDLFIKEVQQYERNITYNRG